MKSHNGRLPRPQRKTQTFTNPQREYKDGKDITQNRPKTAITLRITTRWARTYPDRYFKTSKLTRTAQTTDQLRTISNTSNETPTNLMKQGYAKAITSSRSTQTRRRLRPNIITSVI
ncbi:hypothetical protein A2U01_0043576 [Trifolium medium]|uniref:Uncharacterized protein n=1 Tax=Trifolium medium TaxID=97028 RepID=A0A392QFA4_9FABA|nr:hypothetical protein [Trifolium medium]